MGKTAVHYTQVMMRGLKEAAGHVHVAWVPSEFGKVGRTLRIDELPGLYLVVERGESKPADWVEPKSRDHLRQREASDV